MMVKSKSKTDMPITRSACRDEVIRKLYNECRTTKKREVKIYLQHVEFPVADDYQKEILNELKRKKIIKGYKIKIEEETTQVETIERPVEPNADLIPFVSPEDLKSAKKQYITFDHVQSDYMAIIKCDPQKVVKQLKNDFRKADQKRIVILKIEEVENLFKKEKTLKCGELEFGLETGNVIYGGTVGNLMPDGQEYKVLKLLMEEPNRRFTYNEINQALCLGTSKKDRRDISFIIKNIKRTLEIVRPKKNKDLFHAHNGYMIDCD